MKLGDRAFRQLSELAEGLRVSREEAAAVGIALLHLVAGGGERRRLALRMGTGTLTPGEGQRRLMEYVAAVRDGRMEDRGGGSES